MVNFSEQWRLIRAIVEVLISFNNHRIIYFSKNVKNKFTISINIHDYFHSKSSSIESCWLTRLWVSSNHFKSLRCAGEKHPGKGKLEPLLRKARLSSTWIWLDKVKRPHGFTGHSRLNRRTINQEQIKKIC